MIEIYNKIPYKNHIVYGQVVASSTTNTCASTTPNEAYLLHIKEGCCWVFSEDKKTLVSQGQSLVLQGSYVGKIITDEKSEKFEALSVRFHPEILKTVFQDDLSFLSVNYQIVDNGYTAKLEVSYLINSFFAQLHYFFKNRSLLNDGLLQLKFKEILLLLLQSEQSEAIKHIFHQLFNPHLRSFRAVVEAHVYSGLSLKQLAHLTHMSLSSFKRNFEKEYQTTPANYFWHKRLLKAKYLLKSTDLPISEIAFDCGFKTVSHFSKRFKEHYGDTPTSFRLNLSEQTLDFVG